MKTIKIILISFFSLLLCACNGFFDKDNTPLPSPLVKFMPEVRLRSAWLVDTGTRVGEDYLKLAPAVTNQVVFTAGKDGRVTATDRATGRQLWSVNTRVLISAGPTAADGLVFVGSRDGDVLALNQCDGKLVWRTLASSEVLAAPAVGSGVVLIKSIDGKLIGLSERDGHLLWRYEQTEPVLILRGASAPQICGNQVIAGFANGNIVKLTLEEGSLHWQQTIAIAEGCFAIQRMIDIDANPIVFNNRIYAATYQGRISAMDFTTGKAYWTHDISSYTGLTADRERIYVSDAKSHIWAFDIESGTVDWRQTQLEARNTTSPVLLGNYVVVGDEEGYLHVLSKQDGHFVARVHVDHSGIIAAPVVSNNMLYVITKNGRLAAYYLG